MLCNMKLDMKVMIMKKLCDKNVNVVETNYIKAQKYLSMTRKLAFYWLIVFVTMTILIFSHVKDKNEMFNARGEDMIFNEGRAVWSEIIRVTSKSSKRAARVRFEVKSMNSDKNCTTRSSITTF